MKALKRLLRWWIDPLYVHEFEYVGMWFDRISKEYQMLKLTEKERKTPRYRCKHCGYEVPWIPIKGVCLWGENKRNIHICPSNKGQKLSFFNKVTMSFRFNQKENKSENR